MSWEKEIEKNLENLKSKREKFNYAVLGLTAGTLIFQVNLQNIVQAKKLDLYISIIFYLFSILVGFFRVGNYLLLDELHLYFLTESDTERKIKDRDLLEEIKFKKYKNIIEFVARDKYLLAYQLATYLIGVLAFLGTLINPYITLIKETVRKDIKDLIRMENFIGIVLVIGLFILLFVIFGVIQNKSKLDWWNILQPSTSREIKQRILKLKKGEGDFNISDFVYYVTIRNTYFGEVLKIGRKKIKLKIYKNSGIKIVWVYPRNIVKTKEKRK